MLPRLAVRVVLIENEKILLAQYRKGGDHWYVIPGGGVEEGESLDEALLRETEEECGEVLSRKRFLFMREIMADRHKTNLPKGFHQFEVYFMAERTKDGEMTPKKPDENQEGLVWIDLKKLHELNFFPEGLKEAIATQDWPRDYVGEMR